MGGGEIPKVPDGDFLTAEQILEFSADDEPAEYAPEGEYPCKYCGVLTKQRPYKHKGYSWPACCYKCLDAREPLPKEEPTP